MLENGKTKFLCFIPGKNNQRRILVRDRPTHSDVNIVKRKSKIFSGDTTPKLQTDIVIQWIVDIRDMMDGAWWQWCRHY